MALKHLRTTSTWYTLGENKACYFSAARHYTVARATQIVISHFGDDMGHMSSVQTPLCRSYPASNREVLMLPWRQVCQMACGGLHNSVCKWGHLRAR